jgi:signal transduction histidine kinase
VDLPFIIVSGTIEEEDAVESMRLGADDFITKGRLARLGPAIRRALKEQDERRARRAAEARLAQAQKMEAVGQLAGGVAHDFNNLLGVIQGYGDLLSRELDAEDPRRARVDKLLLATERAATLTRQLLTFSRHQPMQARPLDLNRVVQDLEPMLRRVIAEDIEIVTALASGLHRVLADPAQVEQVLMNLAINARDAIQGPGRLTIETANVELDEAYVKDHPDARPGSFALLAVSDTGQGIDAATLPRIFEPFFTTKEVGQGTGLGLSTVYGIVRQNGGHVAVYTEVGRGSSFKVYLPRTEDEGERPTSAPAPVASRSGSETVLVIEDEEALREVIRDQLEAGGYTVVDGPDPEAAIEAAACHAGPIHLVLTDLVMPRLRGPDAVARVRASRPGVKVLYMSGYANAAAEHQGPLPTEQAFLAKPFSLAALMAKVREVLDAPA